MKMCINLMDERMMTIIVNSSDSIRNVKRNIHQSYQYPPDRQRLVFKGKRLEDDCSLSDYNIQNGSVLHLVLRLRMVHGDAHCRKVQSADWETIRQKFNQRNLLGTWLEPSFPFSSTTISVTDELQQTSTSRKKRSKPETHSSVVCVKARDQKLLYHFNLTYC